MYRLSAAAFAVTLAFATQGAQALTFDQDVTSNVIFGSGNANGGFTVEQFTNNIPPISVELGLRAKLRFDNTNQPQNTYNSNGDGTYDFQAGAAPGGFSFDPNSPTTPVWSFEWSINADVSGTTGNSLSSFQYLLEIDGDPTAGTDFGAGGFDPINVPFADHAIGDNSTAAGDGVTAADPAGYAALIAANNLAQNSWNYEFFNEITDGLFLSQLASFDPTVAGIYTIRLSALSFGDAFATTSIDINVAGVTPVPLPAALPLFAGGLGLMGLLGWRRKRSAAATV